MFWADEIALGLKKHPLHHVDDMKTPSGRIHVGALRGVIIHDLVCKVLIDKGKKSVYTYVINDHDPMDSLPIYLDKTKFQKHLGEPLYKIPSPKLGFKNYAHYWAQEFIDVFESLGARPEIVWSSDLYSSGKMNGVIKEALDQAPETLKIYRKVAGYSEKRKDWLPFQIVCPNCGKLGTTETFDWDVKTVAFNCLPDLVSWAKGCGVQGRISPFGGKGKLLWKVDWPAHWKVLGVTFEGGGKDHFSKGGSWDMAAEICRKIFEYPKPEGIGYEFFLIGGKKMSSSKGQGSSAADVAQILPPELLRFLMVRTPYKRAINFDPSGMTIPDLFDEYDRCASEWFKEGRKSNMGRIFELSQTGKVPKKKINFPRFRDVATYVQMSGVDIRKQFPDIDQEILEERIKYAKIWLESYAPDDFIFRITEKVPEVVKNFSKKQKQYLLALIEILEKEDIETAQDLEKRMYEVAKELELPPSEAFKTIYLSLLGKTHGPRASDIIFTDRQIILKRLKEVIVI
ncbi:MAG: lysine--tRNA ligase [bacterium]|nr:lysine--tRNA ligase [bacterium]